MLVRSAVSLVDIACFFYNVLRFTYQLKGEGDYVTRSLESLEAFEDDTLLSVGWMSLKALFTSPLDRRILALSPLPM